MFALFLCAATSCAGGASTSSVAPPTTTLHPFYEAFPELLDFDPGSEPGLACPDGGGGSQISELDLDRARERFAAEPERYATDGTEAVIRRLEAGGAGSERVAGLRTWLRHAGSSVVLPLAPDRSADPYARRPLERAAIPLDRDAADRFAAVASGLIGLAYGAAGRFGGGRGGR